MRHKEKGWLDLIVWPMANGKTTMTIEHRESKKDVSVFPTLLEATRAVVRFLKKYPTTAKQIENIWILPL